MGFTGYLITVITAAIASVAVTSVIVEKAVKLILRQIKLFHSIHLVELKTRKTVYWIFAVIIGFLIFYIITQMADAEAPSTVAFAELFGVSRVYANIAFMFALIVMIATEMLMLILGLSRNAVVDKGVYTNFDVLDWHQVRDYIIDEKRGMLMLSSDRNTFSTLKNLTPQFKVKKNDIEKLKFILNKNKNKFSGFDDVD